MTDRLYYDDAYLTRFSAKVLETRRENGRTLVRLNRTAFYPTSGGQPHDTGTLNQARVVDVMVAADGEVWHAIEGKLDETKEVLGTIDWPRRFDHMQQHAGEHMLAGALWRRTGGHTIGLHLGAEVSTIDVQMPDGATRISASLLNELEDEVNRLIQRDLPIRCWFPHKEELLTLPLRKPPTVDEHVRIVAIDEEMVACGGTHPSTSGQIGLIKIVDARPSKGKMRVSFVCGMRAIRDYRARTNAADCAAELLSTAVEQLPGAVERLIHESKDLSGELNRLQREMALKRVDELLSRAKPLPDGWRVVCELFDGYEMKTLRDIASALIDRDKTYVLLASRQADGCLLLFARSEGSLINVGSLLSEVARAQGGKGGGKPDFAQGSAPTVEALYQAEEKLHKLHILPEK